jgi:hypothetical protein
MIIIVTTIQVYLQDEKDTQAIESEVT